MITENEKSLSEKLSDDIIELIIQENLQPGDKLPNEQILSQTLQAGRSTIREAMKLLASRNIVDIRQGSGTYVSNKQGIANDPIGLTFIQDKSKLTKDLMEVRFLLEPSIAAMAAQHASSKDIETILRLCDETEMLIRKNEDYKEQDIALHTAIAASTGNLVIPRLVPIIHSSIELFIDMTDRSLREETISSHREIAGAIAAHDPIKAQDAMYLHLIYNRRRLFK